MKTLLFSLLLMLQDCTAELNSLGQDIYDFDSSWAIKSNILSNKFGNKQAMYDDFMTSCREAAGPDDAEQSCDQTEVDRIRMNRLQPAGMRNYTELGFAKIRAPEEVFSLIAKFWKDNEHLTEAEWNEVNSYHNMWTAPSSVVDVQNESLLGGGPELRTQIWEASRKVMEEWTGMHLTPCSMWGVRIYYNDSILVPHVDRNPLVTSAIINVAQDVDEDWPLEVWGHDGKPYNITMKPGDMVLYESHSILHGRPFPMRGRFYANIFVHFEPTGALTYRSDTNLADILMDQVGGVAISHGLPPYIIPGGKWEAEWIKENPRGWELSFADPHEAATNANLNVLKEIALHNLSLLHMPDENGWHPLHEAAVHGHSDVVKFLFEAGADVNELTGEEGGSSPLALAKHYLEDNHPIFEVLEEYGALELGPEL